MFEMQLAHSQVRVAVSLWSRARSTRCLRCGARVGIQLKWLLPRRVARVFHLAPQIRNRPTFSHNNLPILPAECIPWVSCWTDLRPATPSNPSPASYGGYQRTGYGAQGGEDGGGFMGASQQASSQSGGERKVRFFSFVSFISFRLRPISLPPLSNTLLNRHNRATQTTPSAR